jgi:hypothetical protein
MNADKYIQELFTSIDDARANPNDHSGLGQVLRTPTDRYSVALDRQTKRAELWQAIIDFREERISEEDLFMFMQTFDADLDFHGFVRLMGELGYDI